MIFICMIAIVRKFVCVGTMTATFYNQTTKYLKTKQTSFKFIIAHCSLQKS